MGTTEHALERSDGADMASHGSLQSDAMGGEVFRIAETGTQQLEAQARALVQARFFIAKQPHMQRSWDQVEQRLRKECARPGFANSAWWILPLGTDPNKFPKGLSIRFAEAALRLAGNIDVQQQTVFDDSWKRIVRITVMDLETNFAYTSEVTIDKTVERKDPKGREVLAHRQNSQGQLTYVVAASEQELSLKQGSAVSKQIRTQGLRLIPGDILDECKAMIQATRAKGTAAEDPETARKLILDNFSEIGVMPADLAKYLEHDTNIFQPAERDTLRGLFSAIKNGIATWKDAMEAKFGAGDATESDAAKKLKEKLSKKTAAPAATRTQSSSAAPVRDPDDGRTAPGDPAPLKFESWAEVNDKNNGDGIAPGLGLRVFVGGAEFVRPSTEHTWSAKK